MLGIIKDLEGIISGIKSVDDFIIFIEPIAPLFHVITHFFNNHVSIKEVSYPVLCYINILTDNSIQRIRAANNNTYTDDIFKIAVETLSIFCNYFAQAKSHITDTYHSQIKPICKILSIFVNIFTGNYVNIGSYFKMNPKLVLGVFKNLTEIMLSIRVEDVSSYLKKTKMVFKLIKCFYNDFYSIFLPIHNEAFDYLVKIVEEGTQSLESVSLVCSYEIVSFILLRWRSG